MSKFFEDTMQGLLEAVEMEKGNVPLTEKPNMPAPTYVVGDAEKTLIEEMVNLRKAQNMSQSQLASMTGNRQQTISRIEKRENANFLQYSASVGL